jgi:hypothetical protein
MKYHVGRCRVSGLWLVSLNGRELCLHRSWAAALSCALAYVRASPFLYRW